MWGQILIVVLKSIFNYRYEDVYVDREIVNKIYL